MNFIEAVYMEVGILAYFLNDDPGDMLERELDTSNSWYADQYNSIGEFTLVPEDQHEEMALCNVTRLISRCALVRVYAH